MPEQRKHERAALCYGLLALIALAVYLPALEARFVTFDDTYYVTDNPQVQQGLTWEGARWAFTHFHAANWHPLSWLSHMLDCQLYGLKPAGHHLTSVLFHTANTLLLFGLLKYLTGAFWRSACVAALFALHPLHVESVAWVAERKDVLSTFFFLLALWAYARYAGKSVVNSQWSAGSRAKSDRTDRPRTTDCGLLTTDHGARFTFHVSPWYLLSLWAFALGLMSKPMLVTVPFVLLLLDYWPLGRLQLKAGGTRKEAEGIRRQGAKSAPKAHRHTCFLILEKVPFLVLSAASCIVTVIAQHKGGALAALEGGSAVSVASRLINLPISYAWYLVKLVWPADLTAIYPYVREWPAGKVLLSSALILALTGLALWQARQRGYILMGWLWYLGTLVPVIGLVKVGAQSIADRYMYIPCIGLFIILAWGVADLTAGWGQRTIPLAIAATAVLAACAVATGAQLLYWQNTETLFRHALAVTQNNYMACNNLGLYLAQQGEQELAKKYYRAAIAIAPNYQPARNNLGAALVYQKKYGEATATLEEALAINPQSADAQSNLGAALYCDGKADEAIAHLQRAIQLNPDYVLAHYNLGNALLQKDKPSEAAAEFRLAAKINPRYVEAHNNLALALAKQGKLDEAAAEFGRALALQPTSVPAHYGLGEVLMQQGQHNVHEAVEHYREALRLQPDFPEALNNLAWILAANPDPQVRNGREAVRLAERACRLTDNKQPLMIGTLAAAYAEAGQFPEAIASAEKARALAEQSNQAAVAARNGALLEKYRSGQAVRDAQ